METGLKNIN